MLIIVLIIIILVLLALAVIAVRRANRAAPEQPPVHIADDCCGSHAVCERDSLLSKTDQIIYFDDEELDDLAGILSSDFTAVQVEQVEDVFYSLREQDVAGWLRSLQLRNIDLPADIRDQALLIISERREHALETWTAGHA